MKSPISGVKNRSETIQPGKMLPIEKNTNQADGAYSENTTIQTLIRRMIRVKEKGKLNCFFRIGCKITKIFCTLQPIYA